MSAYIVCGGISLFLFVLVCGVVLLLHLNFRAAFNTDEKEYLIEEQYVKDPITYSNLISEEMYRILASDESTWRQEVVINPAWQRKFHLRVFSKGVSGAAQAYRMPIQRATAVINASASNLFRFLSTPAGFQVLDPYNDPNDFDKYIEKFEWPKGRLEIAYANDKASETLVLNAINFDEQLFLSKSILHPSKPGGSKVSNEPKPPNGKTRVFTTYGVQVAALGNDKSLVTIAQLYTSEILNNFIVHSIITNTYWGPMFERMDIALSAPKESVTNHASEL